MGHLLTKQNNDNMIVILSPVCKSILNENEYHTRMKTISIHDQLMLACHRALNLQDQDPLSKTRGCFDRRFWAWKLCDYPEATFQRLVLPLCWYAREEKEPTLKAKAKDAVQLGLEFALSIKHTDGSFDQAYPYEHSYGATAFLLHPLLNAFQFILPAYDPLKKKKIEERLYCSAVYLVKHREQHSFISNHLAGSALALLEAGSYFNETAFLQAGQELVDQIIARQSAEGWYLEYDGADPGYQTLCVHYLAQVFRLTQDKKLRASLEKAIRFLTYFAHPDGSFGGEYGSRRTAVYYPGGVALLGKMLPEAAALQTFMQRSSEEGKTVRVTDMDIGNLAPLLSSMILAEEQKVAPPSKSAVLPCQNGAVQQDFQEAGLSIRGNSRYYAVLGIANGGVCKVFDKKKAQLIYNDCGLILRMQHGIYLTSQHTHLKNETVKIEGSRISFSVPLEEYKSMEQSPGKFLLLRLANLSLMRIRLFNELVKRVMVKILVSPTGSAEMILKTECFFDEDSIRIKKTIMGKTVKAVQALFSASGFTAIHMASARYPLALSGGSELREVDFKALDGALLHEEEIRLAGAKKS